MSVSYIKGIATSFEIRGAAKYTSDMKKVESATTSAVSKMSAALRGFNASNNAITGLGRSLFSIGNSIRRIGYDMANVGAVMSFGLTLPIVGVGKSIIDTGRQFETAMLKIQNLVVKNADLTRYWGRQILEVSADLGQLPVDLAEGLYFVTSGGIRDATVAMETLVDVAKGSSIGLGDMKTVAQATTNIMLAFTEGTYDSARAVDILAAAVLEGKFEADEFARSLGRGLASAATIGTSAEELLAYMAALSRVGISASQAQTSFVSAINSLIKPSAQANAVLEKYNLTMQEVRDAVADQGFARAMINLRQQMEAQGGFEDFSRLFDRRALYGLMIATGERYEDYLAILDEINNANGIVAEGFENVTESIDFKFKAAMAAAQATSIALFETMKGPLSDILMRIAGILDSLTEKINNNPLFAKLIVYAGLFVAAIGPALFVLGNVTKAVGTLVLTFGSLIKGIGTISGFFINVLARGAGFALAALNPLIIVSSKIGQVVSIGVGLAARAFSGLLLATSTVTGFIIRSAIPAVINYARVLAVQAATAALSAAAALKSFALSAALSAGRMLFAASGINAVNAAFVSLVSLLNKNFITRLLVAPLISSLGVLINRFQLFGRTMILTLSVSALRGIKVLERSMVTGILILEKTIVHTLIPLKLAVIKAFSNIGGAFVAVMQFSAQLVGAAWARLFGTFFPNIIGAFLTKLTTFGAAIVNVLMAPIIGAIGRMTAFAVTSITRLLGLLAAKLAVVAASFLTTAATAIVSFAGTAVTALAGIVAAIGPIAAVVAGGIAAIGSFALILGGAVSASSNALGEIKSQSQSFFGKFGPSMKSHGRNIIEQFSKGMIEGLTAVVYALNYIGKIITYWLAPGSPPRILPKIDIWGEMTANEYFKGWQNADFSFLTDMRDNLRSILESMAPSDQTGEQKASMLERVLGGQKAFADALRSVKNLGAVTDGVMESIRRSIGMITPEFDAYVRATLEAAVAADKLAKAQERVNEINERYEKQIAPINKELEGIEAQRQKIADQMRVEELQEILSDARAPEIAKELAKLELREIELRTRKAGLEQAQEVELTDAQKQLAEAEKANDLAEEQLEFAKNILDLQKDTRDLLKEIREAIKEAAEKVKEALEEQGEEGGPMGSIDLAAPLSFDPEDFGSFDTSQFAEPLGDLDEKLELLQQELGKTKDTWLGVFSLIGQRITDWWYGTVSPVLTTVGTFIQTYFGPIWDTIVTEGGRTWETFGTFFSTIYEGNIKSPLTGFLGLLGGLVIAFLQAIPGAITAFSNFVNGPLIQALYSIREWLQTNIPIAIETAKGIFAELKTKWEEAVTAIQTKATEAKTWFDDLKVTLTGLWEKFIILKDTVVTMVTTALGPLILYASWVWGRLKLIWEVIRDGLIPIWINLHKILVVIGQIIIRLATIAIGWLILKLTALREWVEDKVGKAIEKVSDYIKDNFGPQIEDLRAGVEVLTGWFQTFFDLLVKIRDYIKDKFEAALSKAREEADKLTGSFEKVAEFLGKVYEWLLSIKEMLDKISWGDMEPGSPSPIEISLLGINKALKKVNSELGNMDATVTVASVAMADTTTPAAAYAAPAAAGRNVNVNFGNVSISNGMDMAQFEARVRRVIRDTL